MPNYLKEAFKELELLNEEVFPFNKDGAADLQKFLDGDITDDTESIIDPEADSEEDLQDSYEGKVIIACKICNTMQYEDPQDIVIDDESDYVNVGQECPSCSSTDGFKIIGQVAPYCANCDDKHEEEPEEPVEGEAEPVTESLNEKRETGLADVVQQMLDGEFYDMVKSAKTGKMQSVGRKPIVNSDDIGLDDNGLAVRVKDDATAAKVKEIADKFGLETKYEPAHKYDRDKRAIVHIYISEEDWDKDVSDIAFGEELDETLVVENVDSMLLRKLARKALTYGYKHGYESSIDDFLDTLEPNIRSALTDEQIYDLEDAFDEGNRRSFYEESLKDSSYRTREVMTEEPIKESVENVKVETDSDIVEVTPGEDGTVKVEAEPKAKVDAEETIVPVDDKTKDEIEMNDNNFDEEDVDNIDIDEIDIDEFDTLGESYLKKVYENVNSYKSRSSSLKDGKLIVEGIITFSSGKKAKTSFIFENIVKTRNGKIKFIGENLQLSKNRKAFTLTTHADGKKGIVESFNYNYIAKDSKTGKSVSLYGTIKK